MSKKLWEPVLKIQTMVSSTLGYLDLLLDKALEFVVVLHYTMFNKNLITIKVYPSLESDEEDHANKAKMKRKKNWDDTPWSPKGKRLTHSSKTDHAVF